MTTQQIEDYKKVAKVGDRFAYHTSSGSKYDTIYHVQEVYERGPTFSIQATKRDHYCLMEWAWLINYKLVHKEP